MPLHSFFIVFFAINIHLLLQMNLRSFCQGAKKKLKISALEFWLGSNQIYKFVMGKSDIFTLFSLLIEEHGMSLDFWGLYFKALVISSFSFFCYSWVFYILIAIMNNTDLLCFSNLLCYILICFLLVREAILLIFLLAIIDIQYIHLCIFTLSPAIRLVLHIIVLEFLGKLLSVNDRKLISFLILTI